MKPITKSALPLSGLRRLAATSSFFARSLLPSFISSKLCLIKVSVFLAISSYSSWVIHFFPRRRMSCSSIATHSANRFSAGLRSSAASFGLARKIL